MNLKELIESVKFRRVKVIVSWTFNKGIELNDILKDTSGMYNWLLNSRVVDMTKSPLYDIVIHVTELE